MPTPLKYEVEDLMRMHREVKENHPTARWINQDEYKSIWNAMTPQERGIASRDFEYGYCGLELRSGEILILGSEIDGMEDSHVG